jgi:hypothetical protein
MHPLHPLPIHPVAGSGHLGTHSLAPNIYLMVIPLPDEVTDGIQLQLDWQPGGELLILVRFDQVRLPHVSLGQVQLRDKYVPQFGVPNIATSCF